MLTEAGFQVSFTKNFTGPYNSSVRFPINYSSEAGDLGYGEFGGGALNVYKQIRLFKNSTTARGSIWIENKEAWSPESELLWNQST
jgi:hypothetical protein